MNWIAIALLLQLAVTLPQRPALPNPADGGAVPKQLQKDFNKTWERFLKGKEDQKVLSETEKLLKKNKELVPALMIQFYVHQYAGRSAEAERKLEEVLKLRPLDPFALNALADAAYARTDFVRASELYRTLLKVDPASPGLETQTQKSLLLAVDSLLTKGRSALDADDLAGAEASYRQALELAPGEASLHGELASVLLRQGKRDEALAEYQRQTDLGGADTRTRPAAAADPETANALADLEELGRWGPEVGRFRQLASSNSLTRGEFAWLLYRYFPQLSELPQTRRILTDIEDGDIEIHTITALGLIDPMPNHTFVPDRPLTRRDFAQAMARLSRLLQAFPATAPVEPAPEAVAEARPLPDVELAASLGLLPSEAPANSDLSAPTRGEEAVSAAEKLLSILNEKQP